MVRGLYALEFPGLSFGVRCLGFRALGFWGLGFRVLEGLGLRQGSKGSNNWVFGFRIVVM